MPRNGSKKDITAESAIVPKTMRNLRDSIPSNIMAQTLNEEQNSDIPFIPADGQNKEAINIEVPAKFKVDEEADEEDFEDDDTNKTPKTILKKATFALEEEYSQIYVDHKKKNIRPRNLFNPDDDYFYKGEKKPSLFEVKVDREMFEHLNHGDLDEISKNEVAYKIMKEQLRQQQARLIKMKEKKRLKLHTKMLKKYAKRSMEPEELQRFAKLVYHFQLNCCEKRDIPPLIRRIVTNLTCNRHKFMYCPCCKNFNDVDFNPIENITQFMKFVDQELLKWNRIKKGKNADSPKPRSRSSKSKAASRSPSKGRSKTNIKMRNKSVKSFKTNKTTKTNNGKANSEHMEAYDSLDEITDVE